MAVEPPSAPRPSDFEPRSGPLAPANAGFRETYDRLLAAALARLGRERPVIVLLGDDLTLLVDGRRETERVIPLRYHEIKSVDHLVFGVVLALMDLGGGPLPDFARAELTRKLEQIDEARPAIDRLPAADRATQGALLEHARDLVQKTLASGSAAEGELRVRAGRIAALIAQSTAFAVRLELDRLHEVVTGWRRRLGADRWAVALVVICGRHQPRYRDAARQYFGRVLGETEGIGAGVEDRLLYAEGVDDIASAIRLLARHVIDQRASALLFGDRHRLQKDVLADAAAAYLEVLLPAANAEPG